MGDFSPAPPLSHHGAHRKNTEGILRIEVPCLVLGKEKFSCKERILK